MRTKAVHTAPGHHNQADPVAGPDSRSEAMKSTPQMFSLALREDLLQALHAQSCLQAAVFFAPAKKIQESESLVRKRVRAVAGGQDFTAAHKPDCQARANAGARHCCFRSHARATAIFPECRADAVISGNHDVGIAL